MTYRGIYRDGVVVLSGDVELQNGEAVDVNPSSVSRGAAAKKSPMKKVKSVRGKSRAGAKAKTEKHPLPGFGAWKHRTDIVDSAAFARGLRRKVSRRGAVD